MGLYWTLLKVFYVNALIKSNLLCLEALEQMTVVHTPKHQIVTLQIQDYC